MKGYSRVAPLHAAIAALGTLACCLLLPSVWPVSNSGPVGDSITGLPIGLAAVALTAPAKVRFAPGVISGPLGVDAPAFTPDGTTVVFDRSAGSGSILLISHRVQGVWTQPQTAPFSGTWEDQDPAMAPDGSYLVFVSNRPQRPGAAPLPRHAGNLWRVARRGATWGVPQWLPKQVNFDTHLYAPSLASDDSLWFTRPNLATQQLQAFVCRRRGGQYLPAEPVVVGDGRGEVGDPAIAPDQSFLIYDARRGNAGHLFISFPAAGHWSAGQDLGTTDDGDSNWDPHLGPGAQRLYFSSQRGNVVGIWSITLAPWIGRRPTGVARR